MTSTCVHLSLTRPKPCRVKRLSSMFLRCPGLCIQVSNASRPVFGPSAIFSAAPEKSSLDSFNLSKGVFPIRIGVIKEIAGSHICTVIHCDPCNPSVPNQLRAPSAASLRVNESDKLLNSRVCWTDTLLIFTGVNQERKGKKEKNHHWHY